MMSKKKKFNLSQLRIFIILAMTLFIISSCQTTKTSIHGVKKITDYEAMQLKGPIKNLKVKRYHVSKNIRTGKIIKQGLSKANTQNVSYVFNENGNLTKRTSYDVDDQVISKWVYEYDKKKREVIEKVYNNSDDEALFKRIDQYDKNGNKVQHLEYTQDADKPYKEVFKYDKNGNILEEIDYVNGGPLKIRYKYGDNGNLIEKTEHMADKLMMKENYEYDKEGKLTTSKQEEGRTTHAGYVFTKKYKGGKETERKVIKNRKPDGRFVYKYNEQGNRIEYRKYDVDNNLIAGEKIDFEYDHKNNWITKAPLDRRGIPKYLIEREIEYFNK